MLSTQACLFEAMNWLFHFIKAIDLHQAIISSNQNVRHSISCNIKCFQCKDSCTVELRAINTNEVRQEVQQQVKVWGHLIVILSYCMRDTPPFLFSFEISNLWSGECL